MKKLTANYEQELMLVNICKGYVEIGLCCQQIIEVLMERDGRFEGGYSALSRVIKIEPTNIRKNILRVLDYGIFDVEFGKTGYMTPMTAIQLNDDWAFKLAELGKSGEHKRWHE